MLGIVNADCWSEDKALALANSTNTNGGSSSSTSPSSGALSQLSRSNAFLGLAGLVSVLAFFA